MDVGDDRLTPSIRRGLDWLQGKQVLDRVGDWAATRPGLRPGGWAFQYENPHYPISTTPPRSALALDGSMRRDTRRGRSRAEWLIGHASRNGGWGSFRCRQHASLSEPHPLCRSRRPAHSADPRIDPRRRSLRARLASNGPMARAGPTAAVSSRSGIIAGSRIGRPAAGRNPGRVAAQSPDAVEHLFTCSQSSPRANGGGQPVVAESISAWQASAVSQTGDRHG